MTEAPSSAASTPAGGNRLAQETSPYLLQHAANPVEWYPWGEEAFAAARRLDRPVLLSVGYSACHWCHVMAHESFEDAETARLMNEWFINIKVDREERPDIDAVYMTATQALTGQGGWPMTVFMTADGRPFYAGTYFPPQDGHDRPGFPRLLASILHAWSEDRAQLLASAASITERLRAGAEQTASEAAPVTPTMTMADDAVQALRQSYDGARGGFGGAPKFPSPGNLEFLFMHHARAGEMQHEPSARTMALDTLRRMARGGIYDQLGGGFHRYSVDAEWLVPHFEKMLYDNAQLARLYLHAYQLTGERGFERVARETLDYLLREMLDETGGFYAAQDADSEDIEGQFFVWTRAQVEELLAGDASLFCSVYGVTEEGNFVDPHHPELVGRNVLSLPRPLADVAAERGEPVEALEARLAALRARLLAARERRVRPGLDDKVLTSWNGLALAAFAEAGRVLGDARYRDAARRNAAFVRQALWRDGRLLHTYKDGVSKVEGLLEDYAYYGLGLIELYRATGKLEHLAWADELLDAMLARFHDAEGGGFFDSPADGERLLLRQKPLFDAASPSGNGAAASLALWLGRYYGRPDREAIATEVVSLAREQMVLAPGGFGATWQAVELMLAPHREVAIVGSAAARAPFEAEVARRFLPTTVVAPAARGAGLPLLEGRGGTAGPGSAVAYVCEQMACDLPAETVEALRKQLDAVDTRGQGTRGG